MALEPRLELLGYYSLLPSPDLSPILSLHPSSLYLLFWYYQTWAGATPLLGTVSVSDWRERSVKRFPEEPRTWGNTTHLEQTGFLRVQTISWLHILKRWGNWRVNATIMVWCYLHQQANISWAPTTYSDLDPKLLVKRQREGWRSRQLFANLSVQKSYLRWVSWAQHPQKFWLIEPGVADSATLIRASMWFWSGGCGARPPLRNTGLWSDSRPQAVYNPDRVMVTTHKATHSHICFYDAGSTC